MRVAKRRRWCVTLMIGAVLAGGWASAQQSTLKAPVPEAGALGQPKSSRQIGAPDEATRAAIPPDNPQTPEKIDLGQKLFFDARPKHNKGHQFLGSAFSLA